MLPIHGFKTQLYDAIEKHSVVLVCGETGSGKTTQLPQYLHEWYPHWTIGITQPRRVAALAVANRVREEIDQNSKLNSKANIVGSSVRFDNQCQGRQTKLKFMTEGILLQELGQTLSAHHYDLLMIDEAHERSLSTDLLLGVIKHQLRLQLQSSSRNSPQLKVIISSATLEVEKFRRFFTLSKTTTRPAVVIIPGRSFPVDILYSKTKRLCLPAQPRVYCAWVVQTVQELLQTDSYRDHHHHQRGHILVFLTGKDEITHVCRELEKMTLNHVDICPLYAALSSEEQRWVVQEQRQTATGAQEGPFETQRRRKIIVATNVAETSLTLTGVKYVIDTGLVKQKFFDPRGNLERLTIVPISRSSAAQRAGRAGRTAGPGTCFRFYSKSCLETQMPLETVPEIQRSNLISMILYIYAQARARASLTDFEFIDPPNRDTLDRGIFELVALGALENPKQDSPDHYQLTERGKIMSCFPLDPHLSRALIESMWLVMISSEKDSSHEQHQHKLLAVEDLMKILAMLTVEVFYVPSSSCTSPRRTKALDDDHEIQQVFVHPLGDHFTFLNIFNTWMKFVQEESRGYAQELQWCKKYSLHLRGLRTAMLVFQQLQQLCQQHKPRIQQHLCRIQVPPPAYVKSMNRMEIVRHALCAGFYLQSVTRFYPHRPHPSLTMFQTYKFSSMLMKNKKTDVDLKFYTIHLNSWSSKSVATHTRSTRHLRYCIFHDLSPPGSTSQGQCWMMKSMCSVEREWLEFYYQQRQEQQVRTGVEEDQESRIHENQNQNQISRLSSSSAEILKRNKIQAAQTRYQQRKRKFKAT